jgi:hypothetical protein
MTRFDSLGQERDWEPGRELAVIVHVRPFFYCRCHCHSLTPRNSVPSVETSFAVIFLLYTEAIRILPRLRIDSFVIAQDMVTSSLTAV